jgi:isoleucyl-tRNA synthetase
VDDLSTWYLRRSRDRFKGDDASDKEAALKVTHFVMLTFAKLLAPFVPFMAEHLYLKIKNTSMPESVHLCDWPALSEPDKKVLASMEAARKLVETGLAMRAKAGVKVRQPLAEFIYEKGEIKLSSDFEKIIAEELNVKEVSSGKETALNTNLTDALKEEGAVRDMMRAVQEMRKTAALEPSDVIMLHVSTTENVRKILAKYEAEMKKVVGAKEIVFGEIVSEATSVDTEFGKVTMSISR